MNFTGKVIAILEPKSGTSKSTGNAWMNQEFVVESNEMYPKKMCFSVFGEDKIKQFNIQMGAELDVHFDIDANEWQGRWFNSIRAWKVDHLGGAPTTVPTAPKKSIPAYTPEEKEDLPF